jgi:uncharacterized protein YecT (DUF1311 family)
MTYQTGEPWGGALRHVGPVAKPGPVAVPPPQVSPRRTPPLGMIGGGVAVALALGLGLGFLTRPHLQTAPASQPMRAVTPASSSGRMNIEINAPPPSPVVAAAGKLEVLPPGAAHSTPPAQPVSVTVPAAGPRLAAPNPPPLASDRDPACVSGGVAAQMVCADPDLAAADREMGRAYRRALRAGVPPEQLRADQRDWLAAREEAAHRSSGAVASVYDQRIEELNQLSEDGPG